MNNEPTYRAACERAKDARERLQNSLIATKARIAPARLKQDAAAKAVGIAMDGVALTAAKVQQRPAAVGGALAALALYLARRPLTALFRRLFVDDPSTHTDVSENENG